MWAVPFLVLTAFFLFFFRDPDRQVPPGADLVVSPADAALPGHDRDASRLALGVSAAGVLALATPVALLAARRGRVKGSRAGV